MKSIEAIKDLLMTALESRKARIFLDFCMIVLISVVVFRNFLFTPYWPAGGDVLGWISRSYLFGHNMRWMYTWRLHSFGFPENIYIIDLFYMMLYNLLKDPVFLIKFVMFLSFTLAGISAYIFAFKYTQNNLASFSAALIYMINQWIASQLTEAHVDILISYAVFPIIFILFDYALESGKFKHSLLLSLGLTILLTGFHPECIIIYGASLAIFMLVYIFFPSKTESPILRLKKTAKVLLVSVTTCFFLSAFFTIPFISNVNAPYFSPQYSYFLEETYSLSYRNFTDAISLRAIENWGYINVVKDVYYGLALPNFPIYTLLCFIFTVAMITTLVFRRDHRAIFFTIVALFSTIIAMGPFSFFWGFFVWGWNNIPHFAVFRAASRWIMMTALSHTYFISILVDMTINYLKRESSANLEEEPSERRNANMKKAEIHVKSLNSLVRGIRKTLRVSCIFLIAAILLSGFISCAFLFSHGLQVYALPKSYLEPYYWISQDKEDFKIVTVNSPETWIPNSQSDFSYAGMLTDIGWWHDIGHDSPFLHDKPTLQNGGWDFSCRMFVDYLRFHVSRQTLTDKMTKILGAFGYKYIVIPHYAKGKERQFFLNQKGIEIVYNSSDTLILKNNYYVPRIFAVKNYSTVVGGLKSILSLMKIESFNFNESALVFADKNCDLLENSELLIFADSSIMDLIMLKMKDSLIRVADYGFKSWNTSKYWVKLSSWRNAGRFVYWGDALTTNGKNTVEIPFYVEKDGNYYILIHVGFASNRGKLTITVDDIFQTEIKPQAKFWSEMMWVNLTSLNLKRGNHVITLKNDGTGFNDVDSIAVIESSKFRKMEKEVLESIKNSKGSLLYLLEAEINFLKNPNSVWDAEQPPYSDYVISSQGTEINIAQLGNISVSSESDMLVAEAAVDGNPTTRWASMKGMPQWIQIEWKEKQKVRGVKIHFEWAYARDYSIQIWNGTAWIDQLIVKGNHEYRLLHVFPQPVETNKIRIYFTNAPAFNMVSIWELEIYNEQVSTEEVPIYIPREGNYQFFVRVLKEPQHGILHLKVDNKTLNASCYAEIRKIEWTNIGSVYLSQGKHTIGIGATGSVKLDLIAIVSTRENTQPTSINELFRKEDFKKPSISFERINPCLYKVYIEAEEPFILVFSDAYHPLWRTFLDDGTEIQPINLYHIVNGFFVERTGEFYLTLRFIGQDYVDLGFRVSLATFILVIALLIVPERTFRKMKDKLATYL